MKTLTAFSPANRLPLPSIAAGLIALLALSLSEASFFLVPVLMLVLAGSVVVPFRLDSGSRAASSLRIAFGMGAAGFSWWQLQSTVGEASQLFLFPCLGAIAGVEMSLLPWLTQPWGKRRHEVFLMLSGMVLTAGGATFQRYPISYLVPLYFVCLLLALRSTRVQGEASRVPHSKNLLERYPLPRVAFFAVLLMTGATAQAVVRAHANELNQWGMQFLNENAPTQGIGLSTTPRLGSTFGDDGSTQRVLEVQGLGTDPYLRAMSFDTYRHGAWYPLKGDRHTQPLRPRVAIDEPKAYITQFVEDDGLLAAPLDTLDVRVASSLRVSTSREDGTPLRLTPVPTAPFRYELILGNGDPGHGLVDAAPTASQRERYLQTPDEIDPRIRLMAASLGGQLGSDAERIEAVVRYLQANHKYSLKTDRGEGDPVSNFLLEKKDAHCEYFASAATILLRCMGVPTRYVIGYYAHEGSDSGGYTVRFRDAHAWAESYLPGRGWVTVEATPFTGSPAQRSEPVALGTTLRERLEDALMAVRGAVLVAWANWPLGAALTAVGLLWWLGVGLLSRRAPLAEATYAEGDRELRQLQKAFEKALRARGLQCPPHQTWAEALELEQAAWAFYARQFVNGYESVRFGCDGQAKEIEKLRILLHDLKQTKETP